MAARTCNSTCIIIKKNIRTYLLIKRKGPETSSYTSSSLYKNLWCVLHIKNDLKVKYFFRSFYEFQRHNNYLNLLFPAINLWTAAKVHMLICKGI